MSDHLPECPAPHCDYGEPNGECYGYEDCWHRCCCPELRACEQRVTDEHSEPDAYRGWVKGYDDALRDVVRAISTKPKQIGGYAEPWIKLPDAIAAIDALREGDK